MRIDREVVRWFYCDVLGGRQVWPAEHPAGENLCFDVGSGPLAVVPDGRGAVAPVVLSVDDPAELAARCWDAGCTVGVREPASDPPALVVTDPFGQRVVIVPRALRAAGPENGAVR